MPIENFKSYTKPLTDYEVNTLVPVIIKGLKNHQGKDNAITSREIVAQMASKGYNVTDVKLRRCIKYIQYHNLLSWVIATEIGFYSTNNPEEVKTQIESLRSREDAIKSVREALERSIILHKGPIQQKFFAQQ